MAGYIGGLLGVEMTTPVQIVIAIAIVLLCVVINVYGVRLATLLNNIGVALELVVTVGATAFIAVVAFFVSDEHQEMSFPVLLRCRRRPRRRPMRHQCG